MNLSSRYLGLELDNPLVPSASPLARSLDAARRLEDAGAAAIVMHSLFEEQVAGEAEHVVARLAEQDRGHAEARDFLPAFSDFSAGVEGYLRQVEDLKQSIDIPVIASLNGVTQGGWLEQARAMESAGADALELNVYYVAADPEEDSAAVEARYIDLVSKVRAQVGLPIAVKLSPQISALPAFVRRLEEAGTDGVALFNRFYQPEIDPHTLRVVPAWHPAGPAEALLAQRWIAILRSRLDLGLAATGGIRDAEDAARMILAGADVVHLCSALLEKGPGYLSEVLEGLAAWLDSFGFDSLADAQGAVSQGSVRDRAAFERAHYIHALDVFGRNPLPGGGRRR